ncbi:Srl1p PWA37_001630 [Arxiozyma heterogenica]|uniref:Uncharacterized protein n=1 Tax=Arxiozyma heterogenica TaxID=278026 RepID=A0AAN8A8G1_9SACH|nr:hypothetical protein RI543_002536 [Kazachstania heterogenica]
MIFKKVAILFAFGATAVKGLYSNNTATLTTNSNIFGTTTITPDYSVEPVENVSTYADSTTTFYVTNTIYKTYYYTKNPIVSGTMTSSSFSTNHETIASTNAAVTNAPSFIDRQVANASPTMPLYTNSTTVNIDHTTTTITSTLLTTVISSIHNSNTNNNSTLRCVPKTEYVTITAFPEVQYVTVTEDAKTSYVTITIQPTGAFWSNSTVVN